MISKRNWGRHVWQVIILLVISFGFGITIDFGLRESKSSKAKTSAPANMVSGKLQYVETTFYHYRTNARWSTELREIEYKNHSYIYLSGNTTVIHAGHCQCFTNNIH
jgi:hypothetical protein